jgi:drug/metabolite transporter (DMT)-like permease
MRVCAKVAAHDSKQFQRSDSAPTEAPFLFLIGSITVGFANLLWDIGARHGDPVLLAGLAFIEPVISTSLIVLLLGHAIGASDLMGLALILAAVGCSLLSERLRRRLGYV